MPPDSTDRFLTAPVRAARSLPGAYMSPRPSGTLGPPGPPGPSGPSGQLIQLGQLEQLV